MGLRFSLILLASWFSALACSGRTSSDPGSTGAAGASTAVGSGVLLPPIPISDDPETVGSSPVACVGTPDPEAPTLRTCVLAASCSPFPQPTSVSECVAQALPASGALPACAIGAQSCAELNACLGTGFYPDACSADPGTTHCVGTKVVTCDSFPRYFRDCAKSGATCAAYSSEDDGKLDAADCAVVASCADTSDSYHCNGTKRVLCQHGIGFGEDCAARGLACVDAPSGAVCMQAQAPCTQPGMGRCETSGDGSYCDFEGRAHTFECARLGFVCREAPGTVYGIECASPTCSATAAAQCFEECDGALAHLCLGGQRFSLDCRAYGLPACILETRASSGDRARCGYD